jgi:hypothetical protein
VAAGIGIPFVAVTTKVLASAKLLMATKASAVPLLYTNNASQGLNVTV